MIDRTELDALLADPPVEDGSLGAEALRALDGRLNHARTALQVELADAESRHAGRVEELERQRALAAKCAQVIAQLEAGDRDDLLAAATRRRDGAAAEVASLERDVATYAQLSAHGPEWLEGLTVRLDAIAAHLEGAPSGDPAASAGADGLHSLETELASLEESMAGPAADPTRASEDAASRLAALMAEQGMTATAAPGSTAEEEESVEDILAGLPELVQVADDDVGESTAGDDAAAAPAARPPAVASGAETPAASEEEARAGGGVWRAVALGVGSLTAAGAALWWLLL